MRIRILENSRDLSKARAQGSESHFPVHPMAGKERWDVAGYASFGARYAGLSGLFFAISLVVSRGVLDARGASALGLGLGSAAINRWTRRAWAARLRQQVVGAPQAQRWAWPRHADCWRSVANLLVVDVAVALLTTPPATVFAVLWCLVLVATQAEIVHPVCRLTAMGFGYLAGCALLLNFGASMAPQELVIVLAAVGAVAAVFGNSEADRAQEVARRRAVENSEGEAQTRALAVTRDAQIGAQVRTIAHELANLICVIDVATSVRDRFDFERVRRSLHFIKRINRLVLDDVTRAEDIRVCTIAELLSDVDLLLRREVTRDGIEFEILASEAVRPLRVRERSGSLFLILRNLVKNAKDAVLVDQDSGRDRCVLVTVSAWEKGVMLSVWDNGRGMPSEMLRNLVNRQLEPGQATGYGLGFRFVLDECNRNNFDLDLSSSVGNGTTVTIMIPTLARDAEAPVERLAG